MTRRLRGRLLERLRRGATRRARAAMLALASIALAAAVASLSVSRPTVADGLAEDAALSLAAALRPRPPPERVVVVAIDARSLAAPELAVLPRALMSPVLAQTAERALDAGAVAVGFDVVPAFDARDLDFGGDRPLARWDDALLRMLAREGRAGRVVIATTRQAAPARRFTAAAGAAGLGSADLDIDPDGVARRVALSRPAEGGGHAPTLAGALVRAAGGTATGEISLAAPRPVDAGRVVSLIDVLRCEDPAAAGALFAGRVVLVGGVVAGEDRRAGPDRFAAKPGGAPPAEPCAYARPRTRDDEPRAAAGVFLHAAAVEAALSGAPPRPTGPVLGAAAAATGAALGAGAALALTPPAAAAAALAAAAAGLAVATAAFDAGLVFPAARPALGVAFGVLAAWGFSTAFLDRRARRLRSSFGRYLSPALVARLIEQDRPPALDGEARTVAIMFADLSGFTALSQRLEAQALTAAVNRYLGVIAREVEAGGGYVDKFIGDAAMALWNAPLDHPDPARAAVATALSIAAAVERTAAADRAAGAPAFAVKIAVEAGEATVGNVGWARRMSYTAIGPAVNLAARLEATPGLFATPVALGPAAAAAAPTPGLLRLARMRLKGVAGPVEVFAPLGPEAVPLTPRWDAALADFEAGRFAAAAAGWEALAALPWPGSGPAAAMARRARGLEVAPPAEWDGAIAPG